MTDKIKEDDLNKDFDKMQLKKQVFNICINEAIRKAMLSATIIPKDDIEDIIKQLESYKK